MLSSCRLHGRVTKVVNHGCMEHIEQQAVAALERHAERCRPSPDAQRLEAVWARDAQDVLDAQRLRYQVFVDEMGARISPPAGSPPGHDIDGFDAHCEHLIARTVATAHSPAKVVGTYRVLTPDAARRVGGLYSDAEFDLGPLAHLRPRMAELGRSCIAPEWRTGGAILMLWSSLAAFMARNGLDVVIGCASVPMRDGGHSAASLWHQLRREHLAPRDLQVVPRLALPVADLRSDLAAEVPPLIKGYLKCGGKLLGPPAWDPDFCTADLPMMLSMNDMPASYRRRFLNA
jgi:putative hemolysin